MARLDTLIESIHGKPLHTRLAILAGVIVVIVLVYWYFFWSPKSEELERARANLQKKEKTLNEYRAVARELPKFEQEFKRLNKEFEQAALKLPEEKEIPSLIEGVYAAVSAAGLEAVAFTPKREIPRDIYAEIPIEMNVFGSYYELADFFYRVSKLPRIVNVRELNMAREDKRSSGNSIVLKASFTTVTFRLLPATNASDDKQKKGKKRGAR
ncbi:MAG: pilus assembly protein PilO [Deltaproteobacteria bacterium]|jgi:type IV pilus assembly protein PilO|nr:MAG: pilus assembly protein PilO [Deltaproteobacteria bacterium]